MLKNISLFLLFIFLPFLSHAQNKRKASATRITTPIKIDGLLQEAQWQSATWNGQFMQYEPKNGKRPSQETEFAILYDDNNLYVAVVAKDTEAHKIEKRLTRRDDSQGDRIEVQIDSYNDKRTAFAFMVNAAGVKIDGISSNDGGNFDSNWNPIWYVKTNVSSEGWVAEMRIPLDQLRFNAANEQDWGLQVVRMLFRKQEFSLWNNFSLDETGWAQHFGKLTGIKNLSPKRLVEVTPYVLGGVETSKPEKDNPYEKGNKSKYNAGVDGKIGITNDLTLDFSINPDFGQVEADPSQVNLSGFELYLAEQRPFFIEGKNITNFRLSSFGGRFRNDNLFYSRRIGRRPQNGADYDSDTEFVDQPQNSRILGAAKLTGKTKNGWSIGIIESVTAEESAEISKKIDRSEGGGYETREQVVEPLTNYFISRVQKDMNEGSTQLGAMFTATNRSIEHEHLNNLHKNAYSGGIDFGHAWKNRTYYIRANVAASYVEGHTDAILETQTSNRRLYHRPDADYVSVDSAATSLAGYSAEFALGRTGSQGWRYVFSTTVRSTGFETNDIGFLRAADVANELLWVGYRWAQPFSIFRNLNVGAAQWYAVNYGGDRVSWGLDADFNANFKNFWRIGTGISYDGKSLSPSDLRGGPALQQSGGYSMWNRLESDSRKKIIADIGFFNYWGSENQTRIQNVWGGISYRPINSLKISVNARYSTDMRELQYVDQFSEDINNKKIDTRYVFGKIDRKTLSMQFRVDYSITPDLSIQYYGQPFIGTGEYSNFKKITNSRADHIENRYELLGDQITYSTKNEEYTVAERDGSTYTIEQPDFNSKAFISNLVLRWEYLPGSTLFVVWSQGRNVFDEHGRFNFRKDIDKLLFDYPNDIFLVKFSYRIPI